jgi:hypothetical protein
MAKKMTQEKGCLKTGKIIPNGGNAIEVKQGNGRYKQDKQV